MKWLTLVLLFVLAPLTAQAGLVDDTVAKLFSIDTSIDWWVSTVVSVSGLLGLVMALAPQGAPGGVWDKVRTAINWLAANWGNARNVVRK